MWVRISPKPPISFGFVAQSEFWAQEFDSWGCGFKSCRSHFNLFRVRPTGRTLDFGSRNRGSNPLPEAAFSACSLVVLRRLFWEQDDGSSNLSTQTNFHLKFQIWNLRLSRRRSPTGRGACLRNKLMWVRISPSVLTFRVGDVIDSIEVLQTSCKGLNPFRSTKFG